MALDTPGLQALQRRARWASRDGGSVLYLGDALRVLSQVPEASVDCVWTDPPYKLSNGGITCVAGRMVSVDKGEWDRSGGLELDHQFNVDWIAACSRVLKPAGTIWVSGTLHLYPSVGMALLQNGFRLLNDIVWEKPNPPPNLGRRTFTHATEILLWAGNAPKGGRHRHTFNYDAMRQENGGKQMKTVWRFPTPSRGEKRFGKHPTQKPVALIARCLRASTHPGGIVLDPFAGSGSTGVAALEEGRRFMGIEAVAEYAAIARKRLDAATPPPPPIRRQRRALPARCGASRGQGDGAGEACRTRREGLAAAGRRSRCDGLAQRETEQGLGRTRRRAPPRVAAQLVEEPQPGFLGTQGRSVDAHGRRSSCSQGDDGDCNDRPRGSRAESLRGEPPLHEVAQDHCGLPHP